MLRILKGRKKIPECLILYTVITLDASLVLKSHINIMHLKEFSLLHLRRIKK